MQKRRILQWWLLVCLTGVGLILFVIQGGLDYVNRADFTKLSFIIFFMFVYCTCLIGSRMRKGGGIGVAKFCSWMMPLMGMIGTVLGFITMLLVSPFESAKTLEATQTAFNGMFLGMSTALVTTASGLIFSVLLRVQIFNYEYRRKFDHHPAA